MGLLQLPPGKEDAIIVVGAGVFGLSTALHLAKRGYRSVTVFDKQPYDETRYSYFDGCDAASADINKIVRAAYGRQGIYQSLALESIAGWRAWNAEIAGAGSGGLPPGMTNADKVFVNNGELTMSEESELPQFERDTIASMEAEGYRDTQLVAGDEQHEEIARAKGFQFALDPFRRRIKKKAYTGVVDTTGGMAIADKACCYALHKARLAGVKFVLGAENGCLEKLCYTSGTGPKTVTGIQTRGGSVHHASLVIVACGGWTPAILPALDGLCETTAGSVVMLQLPQTSALWERLSPDRFPTWAWNMRKGAEGGLYGFPRDETGRLKIGYRGTKYTNPVKQADGAERSVPATRWSDPPGPKALPAQGMRVIQSFLDEYLPELREEGLDVGMADTRACWYTDSFDNHLVIDAVPDTRGLMVATGGSGHAFKYLPCLGRYIVDIIEGVGVDRAVVKAWKWRKLQDGQTPVNMLMTGGSGARALQNVELYGENSGR